MNEALKLIIPVLLTGLGVVVFSLYSDVGEIEKKQASGEEYVYRIEQLELSVRELQEKGE